MIILKEEKINRFLQELRNYNIAPVFIRSTIYTNENHELFLLLMDLLNEALEYLLAATSEELQNTFHGLEPYFNHLLSETQLLEGDLETLKEVALGIVINLLQDRYFDFKPYLGDDYFSKSIVFEAYPELSNYHNDDKLLLLDTPELQVEKYQSWLLYKQHYLHCHQFLRRGFTSSPNYDFLTRLSKYKNKHPEQMVAIAVDHTRLMPRNSLQQFVEFDRWYGPKLTWQTLDDPYHVGLTVHTRNEDKWLDLLTAPIPKTEFYWSHKDGLKTLQIEEIHSPEVVTKNGQNFIINRYIHSIRDIFNHKFIHLDGAAKIYIPSTYSKRLKEKMPNNNKSDFYIKLFRIDGEISEIEWSELIAFFFRQNEMVLEYLNTANPSINSELSLS